MGNIFELIILAPITNLLLAIYQLVESTGVPFGLGFAIILLTVAMRALLAPLTAQQLKSASKMQSVAPEVAKLKEKYKKNPQRLQAETMLLYKNNGINPAAGCLPVLLQLPILWGLYSVLQHLVKATSVDEINKLAYVDWVKLDKLWDTNFFGIHIAKTPSELLPTLGILIILIPFLTGFSQFIQSKMMVPVKVEDKKGKKQEKKSEPDFATAFQTQSTYIFPFMIGFFSFNFPVGLSLYWITFTVFGIIQQYKIQGAGGMAPLLAKLRR